VPVVHPVASTDLHVRARPDANAASDSSAADALAQALCEHHVWSDLTLNGKGSPKPPTVPFRIPRAILPLAI
jgi:hypothetical protein